MACRFRTPAKPGRCHERGLYRAQRRRRNLASVCRHLFFALCMNLTIISAAIAAAIGFGSAWQIKSWMELENENHRITAARESERELYALEQRRRTQVINAANDARVRESKLRADAVAAQSAVGELRDTIADSVQAARGNPYADAKRANALGELLLECSKEYSEVAGIADRLNSERVMLIDAWPR